MDESTPEDVQPVPSAPGGLEPPASRPEPPPPSARSSPQAGRSRMTPAEKKAFNLKFLLGFFLWYIFNGLACGGIVFLSSYLARSASAQAEGAFLLIAGGIAFVINLVVLVVLFISERAVGWGMLVAMALALLSPFILSAFLLVFCFALSLPGMFIP